MAFTFLEGLESTPMFGGSVEGIAEHMVNIKYVFYRCVKSNGNIEMGTGLWTNCRRIAVLIWDFLFGANGRNGTPFPVMQKCFPCYREALSLIIFAEKVPCWAQK
jgi:hypothetical protein